MCAGGDSAVAGLSLREMRDFHACDCEPVCSSDQTRTVTIMAGALERAIERYGELCADDSGDPSVRVAAAQQAQRLARYFDAEVGRQVHEATAAGASWRTVGAALSIPHTTAHYRWSSGPQEDHDPERLPQVARAS